MQLNGLSTPGLLILNDDDPSDYDFPLPDGWAARRIKASSVTDCYRWAFAEYPDLAWYGVICDDALARTPAFDTKMIENRGRGFCTVNDLRKAPKRSGTALVFDGSFVRAMGGLVLDGFRHLYIDDLWESLGRELGVWTYLPNVIVEHMHPHFGKADVDATYERAWGNDAHDRARFARWVREEKEAMLERMRTIL